MKKYIFILLVICLAACEVIPEDKQLIPVEATVSSSRRHVLIEFTGFRCVNCPDAAATAQSLSSLYGERLIVVAMHPKTNPFTKGLYDYTCPESDSVYLMMGGTESTAFPTGNIDMAQDADGHYLTDRTNWAAWLNSAMLDTVCPYISLRASCDTAQHTISATVLHPELSDARLALWLIEDSIVGAQALSDGTVSMDYVHRHVLRGAAYDDPLGLPTVGSSLETTLPLPEQCYAKHCSIIAVLIDNDDLHILNAYEQKLTMTSSNQ